MSDTLVEVKNLKQYFPVRSGFKTIPLKAVDDVSFEVGRGETLGLVGESGCGKTTVGRTILRLYQPTAGEIRFDGELVTEKNITAMRKQMQMVFQDPYSSLDPRMTVEDIIGEPLDVHHLCANRKERREKKRISDSQREVGEFIQLIHIHVIPIDIVSSVQLFDQILEIEEFLFAVDIIISVIGSGFKNIFIIVRPALPIPYSLILKAIAVRIRTIGDDLFHPDFIIEGLDLFQRIHVRTEINRPFRTVLC